MSDKTEQDFDVWLNGYRSSFVPAIIALLDKIKAQEVRIIEVQGQDSPHFAQEIAMSDIKQPELPEPSLRQGTSFPDGEGADCDMWDADQMHAHYAKGREDERVDCMENEHKLVSYIETLRDELANLKQSLAQPAQEVSMDVSTCDADAGNRIFGQIIGVQDGVILAEETSRNFAQQPAQAAVPEWQPIETAPKGAGPILVNDTNASMPPWTAAIWVEYPEWDGWRYDDDATCDNLPEGPKPTHWMPLPAAPEREGGV